MTEKYAEFHEEMKNKTLKEEFYAAIKKEPGDFEDIDQRALIKRMAFLSDDERFKYRHILVYENLTQDEIKRYERIYPERTGGGKMRIYFPNRDNVEEHYKTHFIRGRAAGDTDGD